MFSVRVLRLLMMNCSVWRDDRCTDCFCWFWAVERCLELICYWIGPAKLAIITLSSGLSKFSSIASFSSCCCCSCSLCRFLCLCDALVLILSGSAGWNTACSTGLLWREDWRVSCTEAAFTEAGGAIACSISTFYTFCWGMAGACVCLGLILILTSFAPQKLIPAYMSVLVGFHGYQACLGVACLGDFGGRGGG